MERGGNGGRCLETCLETTSSDFCIKHRYYYCTQVCTTSQIFCFQHSCISWSPTNTEGTAGWPCYLPSRNALSRRLASKLPSSLLVVIKHAPSLTRTHGLSSSQPEYIMPQQLPEMMRLTEEMNWEILIILQYSKTKGKSVPYIHKAGNITQL